jgi:hypothetical protein
MSSHQNHLLQTLRSFGVYDTLTAQSEFTALPTIEQIERQIRSEAAGIEAGVKRYWEQLAKPGLKPVPVVEDTLLPRERMLSKLRRLEIQSLWESEERQPK